MPPRTSSRAKATGDTAAAKVQLRNADQAARVGKDDRIDVGKVGGADLTFELAGAEFRLAQDVGIMPLMEWAASSDVDVSSVDGLRAVYYVLQDVVHEDDWASFRKHARDNKIEAGDLLDFANGALEALAGRPTEESTGSSGG